MDVPDGQPLLLRRRPQVADVAWDAKGPERALETATGLVRALLALPDLRERVARIVGVDVPFDLDVADPTRGTPSRGVRLRSVLDFVERRSEPDSRLRAVDLKTAACRAGYDPEDLAVHLQAAIYAWALRQTHEDRAADEVALTVGLKLAEPVWRTASSPSQHPPSGGRSCGRWT